MRASLYDVLRGRFVDGRRVEDVREEYHLVPSIVSNLERLFNTRRGTLAHLPNYGLPDITEIYQDIPDSVAKLQNAIEESVKEFEPRLRRIRIRPDQDTDDYMRIVFILTAELPNRQPVRFETTFSSFESPAVKQRTRMS